MHCAPRNTSNICTREFTYFPICLLRTIARTWIKLSNRDIPTVEQVCSICCQCNEKSLSNEGNKSIGNLHFRNFSRCFGSEVKQIAQHALFLHLKWQIVAYQVFLLSPLASSSSSSSSSV